MKLQNLTFQTAHVTLKMVLYKYFKHVTSLLVMTISVRGLQHPDRERNPPRKLPVIICNTPYLLIINKYFTVVTLPASNVRFPHPLNSGLLINNIAMTPPTQTTPITHTFIFFSDLIFLTGDLESFYNNTWVR